MPDILTDHAGHYWNNIKACSHNIEKQMAPCKSTNEVVLYEGHTTGFC